MKDEPAGDEAPESPEVHFEPVVKLVDEVAVTTNEEDESVEFKMYALVESCLICLVAPSCSDLRRSLMSGKNEAPAT